MAIKVQEAALANLRDELDSAYLYEVLASLEKDSLLAEVYRRMAAVERKHAAVWQDKLTTSR